MSTVTYPNPPYPGQGYPQQYPPQYPATPQYPGYGQPQFAPGGYMPPAAPQAAPAPEQPVLARGTLGDFLDQPSGGGGGATSKFFTSTRPLGSWLHLRVSRDLNHSDVRQQTDKFGKPLTFTSSGKPKFVLILPCEVLGSNDGSHGQVFTDGLARVWLKGVPADSFKQAMAAAGVSDPVEALRLGHLAGAEFYMIGAGQKQFGQGNPANMFDFRYTSNGRELTPSAPAPQAERVPLTSAPPTAAEIAADPAAYGYAPAPVPPTPAPAPVPAAPQASPTVPPPGYGQPVQPMPQAPFQPQPGVTYQYDPSQYPQTQVFEQAQPPFGQVPGSPMPPVPPAGLPPVPPSPGVPGTVPAPPFNAPSTMDAEKAALLARLNGGQG